VRGAPRWYVDTTDPLTGHRKRVFFATQKDAQQHQDQVNTQPKPSRTLHALIDPDVTLEAFAAEWFWSQAAAGVWRPMTTRVYGDHLVGRLCAFRLGAREQDTLGAVRVRELGQGHVEALVTGLRQAGFAPETVRVAYRLFGVLLDRAVSRGLLTSHPVDRDLRRELQPFVRSKKDQVKAFTHEQAQRFLAVSAIHAPLLHDLYVTGFCTGLRLGELTALQLDDDQMNLVDGRWVRQLKIERSLGQLSSMQHPTPGPTKSGKTRWVDVATELGAVFDRLRAERPKHALRQAWRPVPTWMFVTSGGHPFNQSNLGKNFHRMLRLAGLADTGLSPHSMRHSFACWHIARGRNAKWLQQQLGHASITITYDVYGDWFRLHDAEAADDLAAGLLGNRIGNTGGR
jgi:integrase